eukprot:scaffold128948_cov42-Phaeocystis_antarctica.AAC.1
MARRNKGAPVPALRSRASRSRPPGDITSSPAADVGSPDVVAGSPAAVEGFRARHGRTRASAAGDARTPALARSPDARGPGGTRRGGGVGGGRDGSGNSGGRCVPREPNGHARRGGGTP